MNTEEKKNLEQTGTNSSKRKREEDIIEKEIKEVEPDKKKKEILEIIENKIDVVDDSLVKLSALTNISGISDKLEYSGAKLLTTLKVKDNSVDMINNNIRLYILLDISGSMFGERLNCLKKVLLKLLDVPLENVLINFFTFNETCIHVIKDKTISECKKDLIEYIENIKAEGETVFYNALYKVFKYILNSKGLIHSILCLSDGQFNPPKEYKVDEDIKKNKLRTKFNELYEKKRTIISTIGYSTDSTIELKDISEIGKGGYFYADNIEKIYEILAKNLSVLLTTFLDLRIVIKKSPEIENFKLISNLTDNSHEIDKEENNEFSIRFENLSKGLKLDIIFEYKIKKHKVLDDPSKFDKTNLFDIRCVYNKIGEINPIIIENVPMCIERKNITGIKLTKNSLFEKNFEQENWLNDVINESIKLSKEIKETEKNEKGKQKIKELLQKNEDFLNSIKKKIQNSNLGITERTSLLKNIKIFKKAIKVSNKENNLNEEDEIEKNIFSSCRSIQQDANFYFKKLEKILQK